MLLIKILRTTVRVLKLNFLTEATNWTRLYKNLKIEIEKKLVFSPVSLKPIKPISFSNRYNNKTSTITDKSITKKV